MGTLDEMNSMFTEELIKLCRQFLGGLWKNATIKQLVGGLSNHLYLVQNSGSELNQAGNLIPEAVLIRMYGPILQESSSLLVHDSVVFTVLSEREIGPKLYGVFPGGRIEEFIPSRSLNRPELRKFSKIISKKFAKLHALQMPLSKHPTWLFETMNRWSNDFKISYNDTDEISPKLQFLILHDLPSLIRDLQRANNSVNNKVVFCHNDMQSGNILLKDSSTSDANPNLVVIDYEYSSFNYRGFDLANHFQEYTFDYSIEKPPYFAYFEKDYPSLDEIKSFLHNYLSFYLDDGEPSHTEIEDLVKEVRFHSLSSHLLYTCWACVQYFTSTVEFDFLEYACLRLNLFLKNRPIIYKELGIPSIDEGKKQLQVSKPE